MVGLLKIVYKMLGVADLEMGWLKAPHKDMLTEVVDEDVDRD